MMFSLIKEYEDLLVTTTDRWKEGRDVPTGIITGVLEDVAFRYRMGAYEAGQPVETLPVTTAIPDDSGPGMTMVEKNLDEHG